MGESPGPAAAKKPIINLSPGAKIRVRSAGTRDEALISQGVFRSLVSVGGENSLAIELDDSTKEEKGRIRLIPLNAILAVDILEAGKMPEEEKRADPAQPAYFR
ncbi:MAG: hypothetical protein L3K08_00790 [Thermoplasmata archaeon]|nr:hypothetical protein [Thermoplasmata archaeon]